MAPAVELRLAPGRRCGTWRTRTRAGRKGSRSSSPRVGTIPKDPKLTCARIEGVPQPHQPEPELEEHNLQRVTVRPGEPVEEEGGSAGPRHRARGGGGVARQPHGGAPPLLRGALRVAGVVGQAQGLPPTGGSR